MGGRKVHVPEASPDPRGKCIYKSEANRHEELEPDMVVNPHLDRVMGQGQRRCISSNQPSKSRMSFSAASTPGNFRYVVHLDKCFRTLSAVEIAPSFQISNPDDLRYPFLKKPTHVTRTYSRTSQLRHPADWQRTPPNTIRTRWIRKFQTLSSTDD